VHNPINHLTVSVKAEHNGIKRQLVLGMNSEVSEMASYVVPWTGYM